MVIDIDYVVDLHNIGKVRVISVKEHSSGKIYCGYRLPPSSPGRVCFREEEVKIVIANSITG